MNKIQILEIFNTKCFNYLDDCLRYNQFSIEHTEDKPGKICTRVSFEQYSNILESENNNLRTRFIFLNRLIRLRDTDGYEAM